MKILIAEDERGSRVMLQSVLKKHGFEVIAAEDGVQAWDRWDADGDLQLAILDWMMPGMEGLEVCRRIREHSERVRRPYTYVIMLTGKNQKDDLIRGIDAGADDYMAKPFHEGELRARLKIGERTLDREGRLRRMATTDLLTGISNRRDILEKLDKEMERARRSGEPVGVVIADVDHFKSINDGYGHDVGDKALVHVAHILANAVRPYDMVGRYGGEEFLMVLPGAGEDVLEPVADRVRRTVAEGAVDLGDKQLKATISMGGAVFTPSGTTSLESVIKSADEALYVAKRSGRNRVVVAGRGAALAATGPAPAEREAA